MTGAPHFPNADKSKQKKKSRAVSVTTTPRPNISAFPHRSIYNGLDGDTCLFANALPPESGGINRASRKRASTKALDYESAREKK